MYLNNAEIDTLKESMNIGVGRAAAMLSELLKYPIKLAIPEIFVLKHNEITESTISETGQKISAVKLFFNGNIDGCAEIVFPSTSAVNLVELLTGEEAGTIDLESVSAVTLCEVGNIVLNGVMGSISNKVESKLEYRVPVYEEYDSYMDIYKPEIMHTMGYIIGKTEFQVIDKEVNGEIILLFGVLSFEKLKNVIKDMMR